MKRGEKIFILKIVLVIGSLAVIAAACSKTEYRRQGIVIAKSDSYEASLFRQNCAICHGNEANGKEVDGKMIPSLRYGEAAKKTEDEIYKQIKHGKLPMPSFENQLSEEDIRRMVKFIKVDLQGRINEKVEKGN